MRIVLKILAWLCALFCGLVAVISIALMVSVLGSPRVAALSVGPKMMMIGTFIAVAAACLYSLWQMVRHLRTPDQATAKNVLAVACFLLAMRLISLIHGLPAPGRSVDYFGNRLDALASLAVAGCLFLFYRLVLKRVAARSFPSGPQSHA